jgi:hypothetical protein
MGDAFSAVPGAALLITPFVHLWSAGPGNITPDTLPADFTEATYSGYAPIALPLPLIGGVNADGTTLGWLKSILFVAGAVVAPGETIAGYWIDEAAVGGTDLYMAERFVTPIPIVTVGDFIDVDVIMPVKMIVELDV